MAGKNEWEAAECDMLVDGVSDILNIFLQMYFEMDERRKVGTEAPVW